LFDQKTGNALCVIDLDTVMPGLSLHDFGDAIRFGASTAAEDEPDLNKVSFDKKMYDLYLKGYLEACGDRLTRREIQLLPMGAKVITYEQALRFLGDYLNGDIYYRTQRPEQNLDRARTQIKLLADMEKLI
ncbi:MAG: mucin desulfatase, partial [Lachnospiraceae bacterium]|nr:mucin desulfatase [Lachnospiraceae bacterium]